MTIDVVWLGHATVLLDIAGTRLLTDPLLHGRAGPLVRVAPPVDPAVVADVDAVLLSHLHADHAQPASLRAVARSGPVLAPHGARGWLRRHGIDHVRELRPGDGVDVGGVPVRAVPAAHDPRRHPLAAPARPIGFLAGGAYFAGDTDLFDGMDALRGRVDVALLPVWGWGSRLGPGHLDPARAARAAALVAARVAVPIHWGTYGLPRPFRGEAASDAPAREFARLARSVAPGVEVRLLRPGQRTSVASRALA